MFALTLSLVVFLFPLAYSPGPGNLYFAAIGGSLGWRGAIWSLTGYHLATFVVTAAIGFGLMGVLQANSTVFNLLRYGGAAYVMWLAWGFFRTGTLNSASAARQATLRDGAILLLLNPKAYVIIALMFSQFLTPNSAAFGAEVIWITAVFTANNLLAFGVWTVAGDLLAKGFRSPQSARRINGLFGVMLAAVSVYMVLR